MAKIMIASILVLAVISVILCSMVLINQPEQVSVPTADQIAAKVVVPSVNTSAIESEIASLNTSVNKDANFKTLVAGLATDEFSQKDNKAIFNFLNDNNYTIDKRTDISSVVVDKVTVTSFDVDNQNAEISQVLKVRFEDSSSTTVKKIKLDVDTTVEDGEVTDQVISFH